MLPVRLFVLASSIGTLAFSLESAAAETVTLTSVRDNTIYQDAAATSNGAGPGCFAGANNFFQVRRALLRFDVASVVPAGSTIQSASLRLFCLRTNAGNVQNSLHRLLTDWGEGTSSGSGQGADATPGDATWSFTFFPTARWTVNGGDFDPAPHAAATIGFSGQSYTFASTPMLTADVQDWLDQPAANFGWMVIGDESAPGTAKEFATRESTLINTAPLLTIEFTPPVTNIPGDINHDGLVDSADADLFVRVLLEVDNDQNHALAADIDHSGLADGDDIAPFLALLIP